MPSPQSRAALRSGPDRSGRFAVGLALRGLAAVAESRGQLADALAAREASLGLVASSLEAAHPEVTLQGGCIGLLGEGRFCHSFSFSVFLFYLVVSTD
jgi:hypothetical protein